MYQPYESGEISLPSGWEWVELQEIADFISRGITPKYDGSTNELVLGQTCIRNNLILLENGRKHAPKNISEKWLQPGDLLINSTGVGSLGRTAQVWFKPANVTVDSHITIVRVNNPLYALYVGFWAFAHERLIESLHTGSTGQTELPRDHVKGIRLVIPDASSLNRFNDVMIPATKMIMDNLDENRSLETLRKTLLPKLMSGEIDVSNIELPTQINSHLAIRFDLLFGKFDSHPAGSPRYQFHYFRHNATGILKRQIADIGIPFCV